MNERSEKRTVLVVDDHPTNRQFVTTLLHYTGYRVLEACDGVEALQVAHEQHPDLIISDIMMPSMDGCELVQNLKANAAVADIPVIFYTATYRAPQARALADSCGVKRVLSKPAEPEEILAVVAEILGTGSRPTEPEATSPLLAIHTSTLRIAALMEVISAMSLEQTPHLVLDFACRAARDIIGAEAAMAACLDANGQARDSGSDTMVGIGVPSIPASLVGRLLAEGRPVRLAHETGAGFRSFLGVPICSQGRCFGWLCLLDKTSALQFSVEDERLAVCVAGQAAIVYQNMLLLQEAEHQWSVFEQLFESAPDGILVRDLQGRIIRCSARLNAMFGYSEGDLKGQTLDALTAVAPAIAGPLGRLPGAGELPIVARRHDGTLFPALLTESVANSEAGGVLIGVVRDVTERLALDQRRRLEVDLARILAAGERVDTVVPDVLVAIRRGTGYAWTSWWDVHPVTQDLCMRCASHDGTGVIQGFEETSRATLLSPGVGLPGKSVASGRAEWFPMNRVDGTCPRFEHAEWVRSGFAFPIRDGERIVAVIEVLGRLPRQTDEAWLVTASFIGTLISTFVERARATDALRSSEELFRQLTDNLPQVFWLADRSTGKNLFVSASHETMFGQPVEELRRRPHAWMDRIHPDDVGRVQADMDAQVRDKDFRIVEPDGAIRWIHSRPFLFEIPAAR